MPSAGQRISIPTAPGKSFKSNAMDLRCGEFYYQIHRAPTPRRKSGREQIGSAKSLDTAHEFDRVWRIRSIKLDTISHVRERMLASVGSGGTSISGRARRVNQRSAS